MQQAASKILANDGEITIELAAYVMWCEHCEKYHVGIAVIGKTAEHMGDFPQFREVLEEDFDDELLAKITASIVLETVYENTKEYFREVMPILVGILRDTTTTTEQDTIFSVN